MGQVNIGTYGISTYEAQYSRNLLSNTVASIFYQARLELALPLKIPTEYSVSGLKELDEKGRCHL